jgi:ribosomal protein S18 acetylase RimI-like enzyme
LIGGLKGYTHWEWMYIALLWVDEKWRRSGIGTDLVRFAEREARRRGCRHAWLDTYDFQGPGFYKKLGYRVFARLPDYPVRGRLRTFFVRHLR